MDTHKSASALLLVFLALACLVPGRADAQKNVVFVLIDALRGDRIDATRDGVPITPYLSSLSGVHFRNAVTPASWTLPAMVSLFTSQYVDTHSVFAGGASLPASMQSMASYLKEAGYTTIGVQTNGNLTAEKGFGRGFDQYSLIPEGQEVAGTVTAQALAATQSLGQPFFLYVHYLDPHLPYIPPQSYRPLFGYPDPALPLSEKAIVEDFMPYFTDHLNYIMGLQPAPTYPVLSPVGKEAVRELYDGESRYADDQVGVMLNDILARYPDTIVVVLADHGDHLWEHNVLSHVVTVYEPLMHVPFIIKAPGLTPADVDDIVDSVDLLPTLADLLDLPAKPAWQGHSVFAAHDPQGPAFSCAKSVGKYNVDLAMARYGSTKILRNRRTGAVELYNLASDPDEAVNLAQQQPATVKQMKALLNRHLRENARKNGADGPLWAEPGGSVQQGMRLQLRAPAGAGCVWFRDGQPLEDTLPHITGTGTSLLYIDQLADADSGEYECMYTDSAEILRISSPFRVDVRPADTLPVFGLGTAAGMMVLFAGLGGLMLRRRGKRIWNDQ